MRAIGVRLLDPGPVAAAARRAITVDPAVAPRDE